MVNLGFLTVTITKTSRVVDEESSVLKAIGFLNRHRRIMEMSMAADHSVRVPYSSNGAQEQQIRAQRLNEDVQRLTMRFGGPTKSSFKVRDRESKGHMVR